MFFPELTRSPAKDYQNKQGNFYADYRKNHDLVSLDCQHRCVYCDILLEEMGHEGMQLDHFRPQHHFPQLEIHPLNLVLACPKCNRLKSKDWPCEKEVGKPSFVGDEGYIDVFENKLSDFMEVDSKGEIIPLKSPTTYIVERLALNRPARSLVRRQRRILSLKSALLEEVSSLLKSLHHEIQNQTIDQTECAERLGELITIQEKITSL